jgi:hypothetical protein
MSIYTIDMRGGSHRPPELLGADQTAPGGYWTSTDFDKAKMDFAKYIREAAKIEDKKVRRYILFNVEKFMVAYRTIALQLGKPYARSDVSEWTAKLPAYGLQYGLVFLSVYRQAHEAGIIPSSVYSPKAYLNEHPEQKPDPRSWYEQLADMAGRRLATALKWGGIGLAAYFILPKLLLTGAKAYQDRKVKAVA